MDDPPAYGPAEPLPAQLPVPGLAAPGVSAGADAAGVLAPAAALRFGRARGLYELAGEFLFFHHALLWGVGGFDGDPVVDFKGETPGFDYWELQLPGRVFSGCPGETSLWACPVEYRDRLLGFLGTIAAYNTEQQVLVQTVLQELPAADVLALHRRGQADAFAGTITCYGVGIMASTITTVYDPRKRLGPLGPIPVEAKPPHREIVARARDLFAAGGGLDEVLGGRRS
jgi:hypothetical protein